MLSTRKTLRSSLAAFSVAALVLVGCDDVADDDLVDDPANDLEETDEFDDEGDDLGEDDDFDDEDDDL